MPGSRNRHKKSSNAVKNQRFEPAKRDDTQDTTSHPFVPDIPAPAGSYASAQDPDYLWRRENLHTKEPEWSDWIMDPPFTVLELKGDQITETYMKDGHSRSQGIVSRQPPNFPDGHLEFEVLDCLRTVCYSIAMFISTWAMMEAIGVGDASASTTYAACLITVQGGFSRLIGAVCTPSNKAVATYAEAKCYHMLASISESQAIAAYMFVPFLKRHPEFVPAMIYRTVPYIKQHSDALSFIPTFYILFVSVCLRGFGGIFSSGSNIAIAEHFASLAHGACTPSLAMRVSVDKENISSLIGMILGILLLPYLETPLYMESVIIVLLVVYLVFDYVAVRGIVFRTLNRQRATLAWMLFSHRGKSHISGPLAPEVIWQSERIFQGPETIRDPWVQPHLIGRCIIGFSPSWVIEQCCLPLKMLHAFDAEPYILWYDPLHVRRPQFYNENGTPCLTLYICFKTWYTPQLILKAWVHAVETCNQMRRGIDPVKAIKDAHQLINAEFPAFVLHMQASGWNLDDNLILTEPPKGLLMTVNETPSRTR